MEYKESLKWVDSSFDADYYDRHILGEPQTSAPKDPIRFNQLDPIGTPRTAAGPFAELNVTPTEEPAVAPTEAPVQQPTKATANQGSTPMTSQLATSAAYQPTDPSAAQS